MLCKVDLTSTFYNKFCVCCSYYHYRGNLSRNKSWNNACDWVVNFSRQLSACARVQNVNKHGGRSHWTRHAARSSTSSFFYQLMVNTSFFTTSDPVSHVLFPISFLVLFFSSSANKVKTKTAIARFLCSMWADAILLVLICNTTYKLPIIAFMFVATCNIEIYCTTSSSSKW